MGAQVPNRYYHAFCCFPQICHPAGWSPCDFPYCNVPHSPPSTRTDFHQKPGTVKQTPSLHPSWSHQTAVPLSGRSSGVQSDRCTHPNQNEGEKHLRQRPSHSPFCTQFFAFQQPYFLFPPSPHLKHTVAPFKYSHWWTSATKAQEQRLYMLLWMQIQKS